MRKEGKESSWFSAFHFVEMLLHSVGLSSGENA